MIPHHPHRSILRGALLALTLLTLAPVAAVAQDIEAGGIYYSIIDDDQVAVVPAWDRGVSLYSGVVILPEQVYCDGVTYAVTTIADRAFWMSGVTQVQLPNSVTAIGREAFADASQLTSITLPLDLAVVSPGMLARTAITTIAVPEGVTVIGDGAFEGCEQLHTVVLPSSVEAIGFNAFSECYDLFEIYCAAPTPPDASDWQTIVGDLTGIDVMLTDSRAASRYQDHPVWGDSRVFSLWIDEELTFTAPQLSTTLFRDSWIGVDLGGHMAYEVYDGNGYLVALTAADRYYLPIDGHDVDYLIVPTNLINDDEYQELALTVGPTAINELLADADDTDPVPHPIISSTDGVIHITAYGLDQPLSIYDMYGRIWYQRPTVTNTLNIDNLPGPRIYIVRVGDYVRKVFVQ